MSKKTKRIFRKSIILFAYCISAIIILLICTTFKKTSLNKLGYSKEDVAIIEKLSKSEINIIKQYKYNKNTVKIVTDSEYKKENLNTYLDYLVTYNKPEGIVKYVNDYKDKIEISDTVLKILSGKYFIDEYLDRYIDYYKEHSDLEIDEVITRINANLDHTFYVDSKPADTSKGMYTLVNKFNSLDSNYVPDDLVQVDRRFTYNNTKLVSVANDNFVKLAEAAEKENLRFLATTCYRDYNFQSTLYYNYVNQDGVANADTYSARPGSSEHQLGYSLDLTNNDWVDFDEFQNTKEYEWLKDNAHKYGFILRYPKGKEYITGYIFEAWHIRYVGVDVATYIYENNITYEEYYAYFIR